MTPFALVVSSPEGDLFRGEAVRISLRGSEGDLAVMAGHTPFVTAVKPCECYVELESGEIMVATTDGGILTVTNERVTLLSGSFEFKK